MTAALIETDNPVAQDRAIVDQSREVLSHHARSFRWAAVFLPSRCHDDAAVAYALCRHIDDTADEAASLEQATTGLAAISEELRGVRRRGVLVDAYLNMAARTDIAQLAAEQLIEGAQSDLCAVRIADDGELLRYCYRVAGTVGLMMCGVLGVRDPAAIYHAVDLGVAMQLTNICRDVLEDAQRNRVYLPKSRLLANGVDPEQLIDSTASAAAVAQVVSDLLDLADRYYRSADDGMHFIPLRARFAIMAASRIYRAIGVKLRQRHQCNPLLGRVSVGAAGKLWWLLIASLATVALSFRRIQRRHQRQLHAPLAGLLPAVAASNES